MSNTDSRLLMVETLDAGQRLDVYVATELETTRSQSTNLIKGKHVTIQGVAQKTGYIVKQGDAVTITFPQVIESLQPENIPLNIMYQDDSIVVIDKPQGLSVHPGGGAFTGTLANSLCYHFKTLSNISGVARPGIVHRLDKDTSGVMVVAKTNEAHLALSNQFSNRMVEKHYVALVEGRPVKDSGEIKTFITRDLKDRKLMKVSTFEGKEAHSLYTVEKRFAEHSLVSFQILTGRTHQIRVHARHLGHPVVGDANYGFRKQRFNVAGQLLHAKSLTFDHPVTGERLTFTSQPSNDFTRILQVLDAQQEE